MLSEYEQNLSKESAEEEDEELEFNMPDIVRCPLLYPFPPIKAKCVCARECVRLCVCACVCVREIERE